MKYEPSIANESQAPGEDAEISELRRGVTSVTEKFVRNNVGWMLVVARRILGDEGHANDCVQDAFSSIFKNLDSFRGESSLRTWMHRIVVNQALMSLRARKRLKEASIDDLLPIFDENGCRVEDRWTDLETPESLLEKSQTKETVIALIDMLPDNYRTVLLLRDIEELSVSEVAELLNLSETNVKVRVHRARSALKKLLEPLLRGEKI
jgi:RNA polymerase sigma-70 factor (ECF subfamily)